MKIDLISIIIPIYNVEQYLNQCMDSVLNQTYKNIEILLINDGSTDYSGEICEKYAKKDRRVRVIHNKNQGVSISRNIGIKEAKGSYITFVDSDDFVSEVYIETLYHLIVNNHADISIIGNDEQLGSKIKKANRKLRKILNPEETIGKILEEKYLSAVCWGKMYKRDLFKNDKMRFDQAMKIGEDLKFMLPIIDNCKKISVDTTQYLYHYRLNEQSITQQKGKKDLWLQEILLSEQIIKWIRKEHPSIVHRAIQRYVRANITFLVKMIKEKSDSLEEEIKQVQNNINDYKFQYLFKGSSRMQDKIKLILITFCPNLLIKLYNLKTN